MRQVCQHIYLIWPWCNYPGTLVYIHFILLVICPWKICFLHWYCCLHTEPTLVHISVKQQHLFITLCHICASNQKASGKYDMHILGKYINICIPFIKLLATTIIVYVLYIPLSYTLNKYGCHIAHTHIPMHCYCKPQITASISQKEKHCNIYLPYCHHTHSSKKYVHQMSHLCYMCK